jgi:uncharacterized protein YyaL (SSP411 family)
MQTPEYSNRLANSSSPYLRQHAHNPVDWYSWGPEALREAKAQDKPILLSIGYSACHWCHVMAHESFEDPDIAALMNRHFINIKVDREERPDLDALYMEALQRLTGSGGWPMTLFLTPNGEPFYGGTYFPPKRRGQMPAFSEILASVAQTWQDQRTAALDVGRQLKASLNIREDPEAHRESNFEEVLRQARFNLQKQVDQTEGGFGYAPKFPQPNALEFILQQSNLQEGLGIADFFKQAIALTLTNMARGGINDQVGGGFHRYSTDRTWLVPHFEKMLYDNALLSSVYLRVWQASGDNEYRRTATATLDFLLNELDSPQGGFYSALDADSEGQEGKFYTWTFSEIKQTLGETEAEAFSKAFGVSQSGNFHESGQPWNVLHYVAKDGNSENWRETLQKLASVRARRVPPHRDEKILAEWNGFTLRAFAEAAFVLKSERYLQAAKTCATFLEEHLLVRDEQGNLRVIRTLPGQGSDRISGFLEDYASLGLGFLALHQTTLERHWLDLAESLASFILRLFSDGSTPGFFQTASDAELLIARRKEEMDHVTPSGNTMAYQLLLRLGRILDRSEWQAMAERWLLSLGDGPADYPASFAGALQLMQELLTPGIELTVAGDLHADSLQPILEIFRQRYFPALIFMAHQEEESPSINLCAFGTCYPPQTTAEDLQHLLATLNLTHKEPK